jgi:hypothetical protein
MMQQRGSLFQRVWFLAAVVALVAAAATSLSIGRAAVPLLAPAGASPLAPVATLELRLSGPREFRFDPLTPGDDSDDQVQTLTPKRCVIESTGDSLVLLGGPAGTFDNGMGVYSGAASGGRGTPCSRVEAGEVLTWTLDHDNPLLDGLHAMAGRADIEAKGNAVVQAELFLGSTSVGTSVLYTGGSTGSAPDGAQTCTNGSSDSGSDAGPSDNCDFILAAVDDGIVFDRIEFTALAGEFSVDDGGDYGSAAGLHRTYLELTDAGVLDCGDSFGGSGAAADVSAVRLDNADTSTCVAILYRLDIDDGVNFIKDPAFQTTAAYVFDLVWEQESASYPIAPTRIVFDTAPVPATAPPAGEEGVPIEICGGQPQKVTGTDPVSGDPIYADTEGNDPDVARLFGINTTPNDPPSATNDLDMVPVSAAGFDEYFEYACVLYEETTYEGADTMVVHQRIYVTGDLRMLR